MHYFVFRAELRASMIFPRAYTFNILLQVNEVNGVNEFNNRIAS